MAKKGKIGSTLLNNDPHNSSAATGLFRAGFIPSKPATALQQAEGWILQMKSILFFWQMFFLEKKCSTNRKKAKHKIHLR